MPKKLNRKGEWSSGMIRNNLHLLRKKIFEKKTISKLSIKMTFEFQWRSTIPPQFTKNFIKSDLTKFNMYNLKMFQKFDKFS